MATKLSAFQTKIVTDAAAAGRPIAGFFELTSRCNFRCRMCYVCGIGDQKSFIDKELTTAQWIELGRQARDAGVLFLTLTGGEILLRSDFWQIYEAYSNMGLLITLFTNGSLFDDDIIGRLVKLPPLKVSITVYGASPQTYGIVTGQPGGYDKVITNIRKLTDAGIKLELKTTVIKHNKDEFEQLARLAQNMGHAMGIVNYVTPRREGTGTDPLANRLDPQELAEYELNAQRIAQILNEESGRQESESAIVDDVMLDDQAAAARDIENANPNAFRCSAGKCAFWVSWEGKIFPCGILTDIQADVLGLGFEDAWNVILKQSYDVPLCQECAVCIHYKYCNTCPARRKLESGDYTKVPAYICECTKARAHAAAAR